MTYRRMVVTTICAAAAGLALPSLAVTVNAQQDKPQGPTVSAAAQSAAAQSLATLPKLVSAANYRELGFASPDEVATATLGAPVPMYFVRLDQLRDYPAGGDPKALLTDLHQLFYPVVVRSDTRSGIVVQETKEGWRVASFGNAGLAKQVAAVGKGETGSPGGAAADMIVQVPALGVFFLGNRNSDGSLRLTPLADSPNYGLRAGATMPAADLFAGLVPYARAYNGLPE
jgi:hypothetical protein